MGLELRPKESAFLTLLREAWESDAAEDCYESLCLSYVAVTRAKRGLYLLSRRLGEESDCRDLNRLLHETFSDLEGKREMRLGMKRSRGGHPWRKPRALRPLPVSTELAFFLAAIPSERLASQRGFVFR